MRRHKHPPAHERFERFVVRPDDDGCWGWVGATDSHGYPHLASGQRPGHVVKAAELFWETTHGPVPPGMSLLHRCDNRRCTNPGHLFLGTQRDNIHDMIAKGRRYTGDHRGTNSVLTENDVLGVKDMLADGLTHSFIARVFGVSKSTVSMIANRSNWAWVGTQTLNS